MCKPFACIRTETAPYLVTLDIVGSTQPSHIDLALPNLVDQLCNRLDRQAVLIQQDQDLCESSFAKLPNGYVLEPQLSVEDGAPVLRLAIDPSRYGSQNLRFDALKLADQMKQSLASLAVEAGSA
jgi:hypothetical protein